MATKKDKKGSPKEQKLVNPNKKSLQKQFEGLDPSDPGQWPLVPQVLVYILTAGVVLFLVYFIMLSGQVEDLEHKKMEEVALKEDYTRKSRIAANLGALEQQQREVEQYVYQLEAKLPSEAHMDVLLSDISKAGASNGLNLEQLKSEPIIIRDYYAEQPISIVATGKTYTDFAKFAEALAKLDRIVTLDDITLEPVDPNLGESSGMKLAGTLKTYRYMSASEQASHRDAGQANKRG